MPWLIHQLRRREDVTTSNMCLVGRGTWLLSSGLSNVRRPRGRATPPGWPQIRSTLSRISGSVWVSFSLYTPCIQDPPLVDVFGYFLQWFLLICNACVYTYCNKMMIKRHVLAQGGMRRLLGKVHTATLYEITENTLIHCYTVKIKMYKYTDSLWENFETSPNQCILPSMQ